MIELNRRDMVREHDILEDALVHPNRGAGHTGADIRQIGQFEETLHGAIFTIGAMEGREDHIEIRNQFKTKTTILGLESIQSGAGGVGQEGTFDQGCQITLFETLAGIRTGQPGTGVGDANLKNLIAVRIEYRQHGASRHEGDFMFAGTTAKEDCDTDLLHHLTIHLRVQSRVPKNREFFKYRLAGQIH